MNKKGFTLIELLASLALISLLFSIGVISYNFVISKSREKVFKAYEDSMHAEAVMYFLNNQNAMPSNNGEITLSINDLQMEPINNPISKDDLCTASYVNAKREDNNGMISFTYKVYLICNDYNSDGNSYQTYID